MRFAGLVLGIILALVDALGATWDIDSIKSVLSDREIDPIEGVWQFPNDGATLLIHKTLASNYEIVLLDSPRLDMPQGVTIGTTNITATPNAYDAQLQSRKLGNKKVKKSSLLLTVTEGGMMRVRPYSQGWSVSLRRWIPYLFRITVKENTAPDGLVGAVRIYPVDSSNYKPCL